MRVVLLTVAVLVALVAVGWSADSASANERDSEHLWSAYPQRMYGDVKADTTNRANLVIEIRDITGDILVDGDGDGVVSATNPADVAAITYEAVVKGWKSDYGSVPLTPAPACAEVRTGGNGGLVTFTCSGITLPQGTDAVVVAVKASYGRTGRPCYPGPSQAYMSWTGTTWTGHADNRQHDPPDAGSSDGQSDYQQVKNAVTSAGMAWDDNVQTHHIGLRILRGDRSAVPPPDDKPKGAKECTGGEACNDR